MCVTLATHISYIMSTRINRIRQKLKIVYLPFLLTLIGANVLYALFRWAFDIHWPLLHLKDDILEFWVPAVITVICCIALRKRIYALQVAGQNGKGFTLYITVAAIFIVVPMVVMQNYMVKASYPLIQVHDEAALQHSPYSHYYSIDQYHILKDQRLVYSNNTVSGRHNEDMNFYTYVVAPVYADTVMPGGYRTAGWYAVKYYKRISNRLAADVQNQAYNAFIDSAEQAFVSNEGVRLPVYFERPLYSSEEDGFLDAIHIKYPDIQRENAVILQPRYTAFSERSDGLTPVLYTTGGFAIIFLLMVLIPKLNEDYAAHRAWTYQKDDLDFLLKYAVPRQPFFATSVLCWLCVLYYLFMVAYGVDIMSPTAGSLLPYGAVQLSSGHGQLWRCILSMFVHFGLLHLFLNLVGLAVAGYLLEPVIGRWRFFISYLLAGTAAGVLAMYLSPDTVQAGASGAIFGLYGVTVGLLITGAIPRDVRVAFWLLLAFFPGIGLVMGFFMPNIGNTDHLAGLIAGVLCGVVMYLLNRDIGNQAAAGGLLSEAEKI